MTTYDELENAIIESDKQKIILWLMFFVLSMRGRILANQEIRGEDIEEYLNRDVNIS